MSSLHLYPFQQESVVKFAPLIAALNGDDMLDRSW
jgi:hypothetical protein